MNMMLPDTIVLMTGAAGGIGRAVCKAMKDAGATVIATDISDAAADLVADDYLSLDVTNVEAWRKAERYVREKYGRLDALVNGAGQSIVVKFEDSPLSEWQRLQSLNVDSMVIGIQVMLPLLKIGGVTRASGASIVNFSSISGKCAAPFNAAYCTSKAAVAMLSKCLGVEFAALGYNIRVNSIHPGGTETPMLGSIIDRFVALNGATSRDVVFESIRAAHPIGRMGRPEELGGGVVFLCSEASSYATCSELIIDGGFGAI